MKSWFDFKKLRNEENGNELTVVIFCVSSKRCHESAWENANDKQTYHDMMNDTCKNFSTKFLISQYITSEFWIDATANR